MLTRRMNSYTSTQMITQMNINSIPMSTNEQASIYTSAANSLVFVKLREALTNA